VKRKSRDSRRIAWGYRESAAHTDTAHLATGCGRRSEAMGKAETASRTKTFLALRIAVNRELEELGQFLSRTPATLNSGGRWVLLT